VYACSYCHLPNGQSRPENAALAGLPAAYIFEQVTDFRSGARVHGGGADAARHRAAGALNPPEGGLNLV
jgi:cytochrome c553